MFFLECLSDLGPGVERFKHFFCLPGIVDAATNLGMRKYAHIFPPMLTFRTMNSKSRLGNTKFSKEEKGEIRKVAKSLNMTMVNEFLEIMPRDMLFVLRTNNLVRSLNLRSVACHGMLIVSLSFASICFKFKSLSLTPFLGCIALPSTISKSNHHFLRGLRIP